MTEEEWLTGGDPGAMAIHADDLGAAPRKFQLLSCAYCRRIWKLLAFPGSRELVELVERFADGHAPRDALADAYDEYAGAVRAALNSDNSALLSAATSAAGFAARACVEGWADNTEGPWLVSDSAAAAVHAEAPDDSTLQSSIELREYRAMCRLVRDIFGNPFRPVAFFPSWRTDTVLTLARQMYESRDFGAMPILADALQDAGCEDEGILVHCRDPKQVHVRGCWVVDLVLGNA